MRPLRVLRSGGHVPVSMLTYDDLPSLFGKRWAWYCRDDIMACLPELTPEQFNRFVAFNESLLPA